MTDFFTFTLCENLQSRHYYYYYYYYANTSVCLFVGICFILLFVICILLSEINDGF